jgi:uncharacterized protein (TIGR00304 family)
VVVTTRKKNFIEVKRALGTMFDLGVAGILLVIAGGVALLAGALRSQKNRGGHAKGGAVLLVGPIPIVFGSDAKWTSIAIALAIILIVIAFLLRPVWS